MNYSEMVITNQDAFASASLLKMASDLAKVLDEDLFQIDLEKISFYSSPPLTDERIWAFEKFCIVCLQAGVEIPPLEIELIKAHLPQKSEDDNELNEEAADYSEYASSQLDGDDSEEARTVLALIEALKIFPRSSNRENVMAVINDALVTKGLAPLRPDYSKMKLLSPSISDPGRPVRVVIVDDSDVDIFSTIIRLAGCPNLQIFFYNYVPKMAWGKLKGDELDQRLGAVVDAVASLDPEIIILDKSMGDIEGTSLVPVLRDRLSKATIIASTGGGMNPFEELGLYENLNKGKELAPLASALRSIRVHT